MHRVALSSSTHWALNASASANNVNGGGFNPANTNFLTNLAADTNTGNTASPVVSSASYNFVAGDVGAWIYIKSGTNTIPGWYQIASVASNKATLNAAIGSGVVPNGSTSFIPSTILGIATVGTPTGITFGIDYSQGTSSINNGTTMSTLTGLSAGPHLSAAGIFSVRHVGNLIHIVSGGNFIPGWYEIVSVSAGTAVVDRPCATTNTATTGVWFVGGAMSLNSTLDSELFNAFVQGNFIWMKKGTYLSGESVSITTSGNKMGRYFSGFNLVRGDRPTLTDRPSFNFAANTFSFSSNYWSVSNIQFTGTADGTITLGGSSIMNNCSIMNTSSVANRVAVYQYDLNSIFNSEIVSYRGTGISVTAPIIVMGCTLHDSNIAISDDNIVANGVYSGNLLFNIISYHYRTTIPAVLINLSNNTFYGAENKLGTGLYFVSETEAVNITNNIFYGLSLGIDNSDLISHNDLGIYRENYNNYFNNTSNVGTGWSQGQNNTAINPLFASVSQITGTSGAFTAANDRIVDTTNNFSILGVAAGNYIYIKSGTGVTAGISKIVSVTTTTNPNDTLILDIAPGTNTTTDKIYQITIGLNFAITNISLKSTGTPGLLPGSNTTGYTDVGAAQSQPPTGVSRSRVQRGM